jgi:hypothetical protein
VVISPRQLLAALPEPVVEGNRIKLGGQAIGLDGKDLVLDKHAAVLPQP